MHKRQYKSDLEILRSEGKNLVKTVTDKRYLHRIEIVNLVLNGMLPSEVAKSIKEAETTISRWVKTVDECGWKALKPKPYSKGRPRIINESREVSLIKDVVHQDAEEYGYYVWDGITVSEFIKDNFHKDISVRSCQRLLRNIGLSRIRPRKFPAKGMENTPQREAFKKKSQS